MAPRRLAFALIGSRRRRRGLLFGDGAALATRAVGACASDDHDPRRTCPAGPCGSVVVIERDGRVHQTAPTAVELGTIPVPELTAMNVAIAATDFDAMRLRRFTGECPVAFDGQEVIYAFGAPTGVERVASCETEIDPGRPAFATLRAGLRAGGIAGVGP